MPKSYSDKEKEHIIKKLKFEASTCMQQFGVRKTTVDELVRRVNIPKGTFYLFYESKELLFWDVINEVHDRIEVEIQKEFELITDNTDCQQLTALIFKLFKLADQSHLLTLMQNGDLEYIMRKLPDEAVQAHFAEDDLHIEKLLSVIPHAGARDPKRFSGALRAVFLTMLHKREIGEAIYDEVLEIMIQGIVMQLLEEV